MEATPAARRRARRTTSPNRSSKRSRMSRPRSRRSRSASGCASRGRSCRSSSRSAIIAFFLYLNRERLAAVPAADPAGATRRSSSLAFVVFYLGFPLRGYRWERLLRETGFVIGLRNSTEILYISWFVNCVVPAKLGDVYRAYLLKINSAASLSRTFGTVFIERILDIFAIAILGLAAGFWSFRDGLPPAIQARLRRRHRGRRRGRRRAVHDAQLRPADPRPAAAAARGPRAVRPVRGGRLRGGRAPRTCRSSRS